MAVLRPVAKTIVVLVAATLLVVQREAVVAFPAIRQVVVVAVRGERGAGQGGQHGGSSGRRDGEAS